MGLWQKIQHGLKAMDDATTPERRDPRQTRAAQAGAIGPRAPVQVRPGAALRIAPGSPLTVQPPQRGLWDERGWAYEQQNGVRYYQGFYQACDRRARRTLYWAGRVVASGRNEVIAYLAEPPESLTRHPKWVCFSHEGGRWYRLHWRRKAANVDDAISYLEKILDEAVNV